MEDWHRCLVKACCERSRRDHAVVAWHEVPGKATLERTVPRGTV